MSSDPNQPRSVPTVRQVGRWWRYAFGIGGALILVGLSVASYNAITGGLLGAHEKQVQVALRAALDSKSTQLRLEDVAAFAWAKVCVVAPYADKEHVEKKLGFAWSGYDEVKWWGHDGFWTLLFVENNQRVVPVRIPRVDIGDFPSDEAHWQSCVARDAATLVVIPADSKQGQPRRFRFWKN